MNCVSLLVAVFLLAPPSGGLCADRPTIVCASDECPRLSMTCPSASVQHGEPLTFTASISGGSPNARYSFNWTVTAGTITSGQGTPTITVDTTGLDGQQLTATVEVGGFPAQCAKSDSCVAEVRPQPLVIHPLDRYGYLKFTDERARLDNFAIQLQQEPDTVGYIVTYAGKGVRPKEARDRARRAKGYVVGVRGVKSSRVVMVYGGREDGFSTTLWILTRSTSINFGRTIK